MGRKRQLPRLVRREIRDRLNKAIKNSPYGSAYALEQRLNLTHSALAGWLNSVDPVTPDTVSLYRLSEALGLSIDWLLFNIGPEQRGAVRATGEFTADFRAQLTALLRGRGAFSEEELNDFLPIEAAAELWESVVSRYAWLLLDQHRDEYDRSIQKDYLAWALKQVESGRKREVRPFYEVERRRPF